MARLAADTEAALKARAIALHQAADRLTKLNGELIYVVFPTTARAFVWATFRGADPTPAVLKTVYGTDHGLGPAAHAHIAALVAHLMACSAGAATR
ncbi:hypothetical protein GVN21_16765 [Caulobacter sp. SLTY]|uniref:hypothetical protein n=1 Tax=Caulobacter sp. SLTY TaxID=2683262 RepID=UPI00141228D5|nr:hypothetical protein [Caulobacter sp. SLTY]NBB17020.1 hypothetical protein [Caulobacter sp. SLTY]